MKYKLKSRPKCTGKEPNTKLDRAPPFACRIKANAPQAGNPAEEQQRKAGPEAFARGTPTPHPAQQSFRSALICPIRVISVPSASALVHLLNLFNSRCNSLRRSASLGTCNL